MPQPMRIMFVSHIVHFHILQNKVFWTQIRCDETSVECILYSFKQPLKGGHTPHPQTLTILASPSVPQKVALGTSAWLVLSVPSLLHNSSSFSFFLLPILSQFLLPLYHLRPSQFYLLLTFFFFFFIFSCASLYFLKIMFNILLFIAIASWQNILSG